VAPRILATGGTREVVVLALPQLSMMAVILYGWAVFTSLLLWVLYGSR
jgi:hypothetical protein